ncbi:polysaccharide pyruvyl transferase family protein [Sedimentibacter sp. zth1]|uniref:polysaccharide pyruvyl transferase family protein n=1 Tax=Sedimentibacter sp. zth1 TaxID=2816908 RepID=UPI001A93751F|nr:polysaccharide pyruvyl transferase family protein [Sedimentibacter sp. zth1]QSX05295.1 polysaccharide pyruvyl transferase family protein [Sedimentibacter sp. zth1]
MRENLRIGITGPISEINFGDYAMFINNIYDIDIKNITVFSYNKGFSEIILKDYCEGYDVKTVEVKLYASNKIDDELSEEEKNKPKVGFQPFNRPTDTPLDILYRVENLEEIREYVDNIDMLVVNGGGYFNHLWNNSLWRSDMLKKIIVPMLIANQKKKKIFFTGNSFGPFDLSEEYFNYIFNYLKNTTYAVRDRMYSTGYLSRLNIDKNNINFIPDDLFIINDSLLKLPTHNMVDFSRIGKYIVLEVYYSLEEIKNYIKELKSFNESIYLKYGLSIVFIPFDFKRGGMWQGEYLSKELSNFYLCDLNLTGYLPIQDAYQIIKNAELVICTRYHAMVLSVGAGVPVINTIKKVCDDHRYYFNKNYGLLEYVFEDLEFNEMDFIRTDFPTTLKYLEENLLDVIRIQKSLYETVQYNSNKDNLKKTRFNYLKKIDVM